MRAQDDEPAAPASPRWLWWALALALLLLASGAGVVRGFSPTKVDHAEAVKRAAIGGFLGLAVAGIAIAAWAWYRRRRGIAAGAFGGALAAGLIALLIAAAASIGAATAPPSTTGGEQEKPATTNTSAGEKVKPNGGALDQRTGKVYVDTNGDGVLDTELIDCPPPPQTTLVPGATTTVPPTTSLPPYRVGDKVRVLIDNECDGTIDDIIYVEVKAQVELGGTGGTTPPSTTKPTTPDKPSKQDTSKTDMGTLLFVLLAIAVTAGVVIAVLRWLSVRGPKAAVPLPPPAPPEPPADDAIDEAAAAESFAESGRIIVDDADPRRAIVAAYGALLQGLEAAGAPRSPFEAPEEHLQRSLQQLRVPPAPLSAVTRLFLVARFSTHPLGEPERREARDALAEAERHLREIIRTRAQDER